TTTTSSTRPGAPSSTRRYRAESGSASNPDGGVGPRGPRPERAGVKAAGRVGQLLARLRGFKPMPRYHIIITSRDAEAMLDLVRVHKINVLDHGQRRMQEGFLVH